MEQQARMKNHQIQQALAREYDQTIRDKKRRQEEDQRNTEQIEKQQLDIGTKLSLTDPAPGRTDALDCNSNMITFRPKSFPRI